VSERRWPFRHASSGAIVSDDGPFACKASPGPGCEGRPARLLV
jgi:hypothetical protein